MSTKTIAQKLLIKPNTSIWLSHPAHIALIEPLPEGVTQADGLEQAATALVFAEGASAVRELLNTHKDQLAQPTTLWVLYPKGNRADINRDSLWPIVSAYGMHPIGQVAVDDVWSALRFRPNKEGEAPFTGGQ